MRCDLAVYMAAEIKCRFGKIDNGEMSADMVFSQMTEHGMISDMVRRYLGNGYVDRVKLWEDAIIEDRIQHLWEYGYETKDIYGGRFANYNL